MRGKRKEVRKGISQSHTLATPGRGGGRGERDSQGEKDVDGGCGPLQTMCFLTYEFFSDRFFSESPSIKTL